MSLLGGLVEALESRDDVVRARAAHALEKVSRIEHGAVKPLLPFLISLGDNDHVPMVRWHIAMILGNLQYEEAELDAPIESLFRLLGDSSTFVRNWAIVSLSNLAGEHEKYSGNILEKIRDLREDEAPSVRSRVAKAIKVLVKVAEGSDL